MAIDSPINLYHAVKKPPLQTTKKVVGSLSKSNLQKHKTVSKKMTQLKIFDSSEKMMLNEVKTNLKNLFDESNNQSPLSS